jgi:hypothetical protein
MKTRLTLTLLLILLAAVVAAAAIFFLLTRPQPPAPSAQPLPARAAQPGRAAPSLTLIAESITNTVTGQAVSANAYLNGTLLRSLGKSVLRPQHNTAKRHCATNWETNEFSLQKAIRCIPNSLYSKFVVVTHFQVTVPMDGSAEMRVAAPGYKPWGIRPRGGGSDKVMRGPVQLVRE